MEKRFFSTVEVMWKLWLIEWNYGGTCRKRTSPCSVLPLYTKDEWVKFSFHFTHFPRFIGSLNSGIDIETATI
ncbi:hypothetical protein NC651_033885 [Populus alba x Populus x berolinensis]|nr:hypothetical protein NC651_033885 [Populus alba x Populus x berolinensis]